jgi:hypothetical protein
MFAEIGKRVIQIDGLNKYPLVRYQPLLGFRYIPTGNCQSFARIPHDRLVLTHSRISCPNLNTAIAFVEENLSGLENSSFRIFTNTSVIPEWKKLSVSSSGPSGTGVLKPDFLALGKSIFSAHVGERDCGRMRLMQRSGSSMATPVISAAAALLLGYFESVHEHNASASLVKAALIHSTNRSDPTCDNGYGLTVLERVMAFPDSKFPLAFVDQVTLASDQQIGIPITIVESGESLFITLSWIDPPMMTESDLPLFANLGLMIIGPMGNITVAQDHRTTNRRIVVKKAIQGNYEIIVICPLLFANESIPYALTITGKMDSSGAVQPGFPKFRFKQCQRLAVGHNCEQPVRDGFPSIHTLKHRKIQHFGVIAEAGGLTFTLEVWNPKQGILQAEVSVGQLASTGGTLLKFAVIREARTVFTLTRATHAEVVEGAWIYLSLYEASLDERVVFLSSGNDVAEREEYEIRRGLFMAAWFTLLSLILVALAIMRPKGASTTEGEPESVDLEQRSEVGM